VNSDRPLSTAAMRSSAWTRPSLMTVESRGCEELHVILLVDDQPEAEQSILEDQVLRAFLEGYRQVKVWVHCRHAL